MGRPFYLGVAAAVLAAFAWSSNFIAPFMIGNFSPFDLALVRHVVSGLVGLCILLLEKNISQHLTRRNWLVASWLAFIGYVGYFLTVTGAAIYCGPVVAPAFVGLVPIVLALVGNLRQGSVPWRALSVPLALVSIGLLLVNGAAFTAEGLDSARSLPIGIPLAAAAVVLWVWFAIENQAAMAARPDMPSSVWTALILVGGGIQMLAMAPFGTALGLFQLSKLGFAYDVAGRLYVWGASLALLATVGGVWAWNMAARILPIALAAQLIVLETVFGIIGGLVIHARWPTAVESGGIVILIAGVLLTIRVFHEGRSRSSRCHVQDA
ncbi:DMT family transporter [Labrys wisconsinensis]|uniref:Drug/metabolite transporter (DMT)-like permease n=1 Tax=Labrys wisconsinensis TaxID=425677 RepID=A0ABU0J3Z2_9HYPH|nr:DMT family transporter [Labrys wisconsinensis]MDQ0468987.1 drug/metabolite transporter (DMT)-like permease [Labrys wisconsinensis]